MSWDYAQLSKTAKIAGGPDALLNQVYSSGRNVGRADMVPYLLLAAGGGAALFKGITEIIRLIDEYKSYNETKAQVAMQEIKEGIRDYDREMSGMDEDQKDDDNYA